MATIRNFNELNDIEGLQFIPISTTKIPKVKNWQHSLEKHDLNIGQGVGVVCGASSNGLQVIDIDAKYDLTGVLFEQYKRLINEVNPDLLKKLVVQKTKNGGYHFIFRCSEISGNQKLANRPTTEEEKRKAYDDVYKDELKKGADDAKARKEADKAYKNDKVRVLLETREEGGYIACYPTEGYEMIYGDFFSISELTPEERETLHSIARQFNQTLPEEPSIKKTVPKAAQEGLSTFEDYNQRGDVVALLQEHGWKIVGQKGQKTIFLRPGQTTSQSSGNFDHEKNWFSVFTTSSEFEPETAYLPYAVYAYLECNKDFQLASKKLFELGYGEKLKSKDKEKTSSTRVIQSRINPDDGDYSFLAAADDYDGYLGQVIDGTLPMGLTTGSPELDANFLFKEGNMVSINGIDNTGKTSFILWLELLAALYHNWKGILFVSENSLGGVMRKLIQFYWGKQLHGNFAMSKEEYHVAKQFIEKHFFLIKAQEDLFNYKDILNMVRKARQKTPELKYCMIDPYNSLKVDLSGFSKLSTHEYHYEALSELKAYGQQTRFGWFVNHHAYSAAARLKDGEKKYPVAPKKEDTEGGVKVANKTDDFLTIHRLTQHPSDWMITEVHVRKIKDTETGGRPTPLEMPIRFEMYKGGTAFREKTEMGYGIDPIEEWHYKNGTKIDHRKENGAFNFDNLKMPYKDGNDDPLPTDIKF
jgi:hypothetical protein